MKALERAGAVLLPMVVALAALAAPTTATARSGSVDTPLHLLRTITVTGPNASTFYGYHALTAAGRHHRIYLRYNRTHELAVSTSNGRAKRLPRVNPRGGQVFAPSTGYLYAFDKRRHVTWIVRGRHVVKRAATPGAIGVDVGNGDVEIVTDVAANGDTKLVRYHGTHRRGHTRICRDAGAKWFTGRRSGMVYNPHDGLLYVVCPPSIPRSRRGGAEIFNGTHRVGMITNTRVKYVVVDRPRDLAYFVSPEKVTVVHGSQVVGAVKFGQQQRSQRTGDADVSQTNGDLYLGIIGQGAAPSFVTVLNGTSIVGLVPGVDGRRIVANQDTGVAYAEDLSGHVTVLDGTNVAGHLTLTAALNSWDPVTRTVIADGTLQTALARGATPTLVVIRGTKVVQRLDYPSTIDLTNDPAAHRMYLIVGRTKAKTGARIAELRSQPVN